MRYQHNSKRRRGVILLVVLAMITLLAILGITFVMNADATATGARIYREAQVISSYSRINDLTVTDSGIAWESFLGQLIYDLNDDDTGIRSAFRGHSLARTKYGWNPASYLNDRPWTGTGRLVEPGLMLNTVAINGQTAFNYQAFIPSGAAAAEVRDPGRLGARLSNSPIQGTLTGDLNVDYTYPDQHNMYLAMQDPLTGQILVPSYHRDWLQGALDTTAATGNWPAGVAAGKHVLLRPRPADHSGFPAPASATGDVKQLDWAPGGNDSIWMDFNSPVKIGPDGRKYKCMVAPLILPIDGRINLHTAGNVLGPTNTHASNQGWGPWEVNLNRVLTAPGADVQQLFFGAPIGNPTVQGKYGALQRPRGTAVSGGTALGRRYPVDFNAVRDPAALTGAAALSARFSFPGQGTNAVHRLYPSYLASDYGNAVPTETTHNGDAAQPGGTGIPNHPSIYNVYRPFNDLVTPVNSNRNFAASEMAAILRLQNLGAEGLPSDLLSTLLANNIGGPGALPNGTPGSENNAYRRLLVTTLSAELDRPGGPPSVWDPATAAYTFKQALPDADPTDPNTWRATGAPLPFRAIDATSRAAAPPAGSDYDPATWKARLPAFKIDLKRSLAEYPTPAAGTGTFGAGVAQARIALLDRQNLAKDIFDRLLLVTGAMQPAVALAQTGGASSPEFRAVRWLAQHAVNLVDAIDNDEYSTPFAFVPGSNAHWVFGVEAPRLVINEYYAQWDNDLANVQLNMAAYKQLGGNYKVNVWVELHNPAAADASHPEGGNALLQAGTGAGAKAIYRLRLAARRSDNLRDPDNSLGKFDTGTDSTVPSSVVDDWGAMAATHVVQPHAGTPYQLADKSTAGFYVVGPDPDYGAAAATPTLFLSNPNLAARATHTTNRLSIDKPVAQDPMGDPAQRPALYLERLANPYLPVQEDATQPDYNPYITVDYVAALNVEDGRRYDTTMPVVPMNAVTARKAHGKYHPLAAKYDPLAAVSMWKVQNPATKPANQPENTFFRHNSTTDAAPTAADTTLQWPFDTFVHHDRIPTSIADLLHVSGVRPHELTQTFMTSQTARFRHRAHWGEASNKLYRLLDHLTVGPWGGGTDANGRIPGRVNVNALWDVNVFRALCDAVAGNHFTAAEVDAVYAELVASRSPDSGTALLGGTPVARPVPGLNSRPFRGLGHGYADANTDPLGAAPTNSPAGRSLSHTLLRPSALAGTVPQATSDHSQRRMTEATDAFTASAGSPYGGQPLRRFELMSKIQNHLTTRSNVFAVWATVGFFEVLDDTSAPVKLGAEIDWPNLGRIRHRMFAIVDRSQLQSWPTRDERGVPLCRATGDLATGGGPIVAGLDAATRQPSVKTFNLVNSAGGTLGMNNPAGGVYAVTNINTGRAWLPQAGALLTFDPDTDNEETVEVISAVGGAGTAYTVSAAFRKSHAAGSVVINRGNPGPWIQYDPRKDPAVVPYHIVFE